MFTQKVYKPASLSLVHINPSILEGTFLYPSTLGPDLAVRLERSDPVLINLPVIEGDPTIGNILTCFPGVWSSAPTATYTYAWYIDGSVLPLETNQTIQTTLDMDGLELFCRVTATNGTSASADSLVVFPTIIQPVEIFEFPLAVITGWVKTTEIRNFGQFNYAVSGILVKPEVRNSTAAFYGTSGMPRLGNAQALDLATYIIDYPVQLTGYGSSYGNNYGL